MKAKSMPKHAVGSNKLNVQKFRRCDVQGLDQTVLRLTWGPYD